ncbi:hypothetical protein K7X08_026760 [Anisodus acutangulus]|uniref:Retrotransposon gag domain-containing protein n=1 Tax=Anisodus acutangulus TaxID=402998 RepID=A0A9Q1QXR1_9SOLA|nr:hypothetical protein K7X08_026760 [Anisodus acutangulus]
MAHVAEPNEQRCATDMQSKLNLYYHSIKHGFSEISECEEMDRQVMIRTNESVAKDIHSLKEAFKNIQTIKGHEGLEYEDLCMHPDIELSVGYKVPKFGLFDGKGNPHAHLRSYCDKLIGVGKDQAIIMKLFVRSLTGEALDWYTSQNPQKWRNWGTMAQDFVDKFKFNTDTVLDRFYMMKLEKKPTETFREYAMKWRAEAAKVQPPIEESEMNTLFVQSLKDATYYERMISVIGRSFSEVIRMRDFIEEGIRTGRITNFVALQATSETIQSDSCEGAVKRKRDGVSSVVTIQKHRPNQMSTYQMPSPQPPYYNQNNQSPHPSYYYPYTQSPQPYYQYPPGPYPIYHTHPIYSLPRAPVYPNPPQYQPAYLPHPQVHTPNAPALARKYERKPPKPIHL